MNEGDRVLCSRRLKTPLGWLLTVSRREALCLVHFCDGGPWEEEKIRAFVRKAFPDLPRREEASVVLDRLEEALERYFTQCAPLPSFPLDSGRGTSFQRRVWEALGTIPFGEKRAYGQVASLIGRPRSSRAVGQACGRNPLAIVTPCHRVVASNGGLGGYSAGLKRKRALLELERGRPVSWEFNAHL